jgi:penicillin-binding protein 2
MASSEVNLADRSGSLVESHKGYDPRIIFFYFVLAALLLTLVGGLAYQQIFKNVQHSEAERQQNQRRVIIPGPRGNIYDRDGRILVGNRPRFSVVLYVDELRGELLREHVRIRKNYRALGDKDLQYGDIEQIARVSVAQRYLDQVNSILHRDPNGEDAQINAKRLKEHFSRTLLLPYTLIDDLSPEDYARLIEELPVNSPLQVYSSSTRNYPYGSAAAHTLGYVRWNNDKEMDAEDFPGDKLHTTTMKGANGEGGLEKEFDDTLKGTPGGSIFRVDPAGFRINPPLKELRPRQGNSITTSLDIDLQQIAEDGIGDQVGSAVAIDVATGEILVLASKPDYDLNEFSPHATTELMAKMNDTPGIWVNNAVSGLYPPGSTFKTLVSIAGLRSGRLDPDDNHIDCEGVTHIGRQTKKCDEIHGRLTLSEAIAQSCDIYFYHHGIDIGPDVIAREARRFHLDKPTGIELPAENRGMVIPDAAWKKQRHPDEGPWSDGDTANMAIGQGYVLVTPLEMACYAASLARGETYTKPTIIHDPKHPRQHSEPIGLTAAQRAVLMSGMLGCTSPGEHHTASVLSTLEVYRIPGMQIAGKTGTAQKKVTKDGKVGNINFAWFICFAPADKPQIAMAVMLEGDTIGETFGGGQHAAPIAAMVMKKYFEKQAHPAGPVISPFKKVAVQ